MAALDDTHASLLHAIERVEADLALVASLLQPFDRAKGPPKLIDDAPCAASVFLIERALNKMRAETAADAIDVTPVAH
jgi:hypothetical protein